jgi:hypothetical protein
MDVDREQLSKAIQSPAGWHFINNALKLTYFVSFKCRAKNRKWYYVHAFSTASLTKQELQQISGVVEQEKAIKEKKAKQYLLDLVASMLERDRTGIKSCRGYFHLEEYQIFTGNN